MASTSSRLLRLLSLLGARGAWSGEELSARLGVSTRTVRRDVECLRELGYHVRAALGPDGGYALGLSEDLPPLLLDEEQALAIAVALQAVPRAVSGIEEAVRRALTNLERVMSPTLRAEAEAAHLTVAWNSWEFHGPPIPSATLTAVGSAVRNQHLLRFDLLTPEGRRPHPRDPDFTPPCVVEPHHLVLWAGRWYLVAHAPGSEEPWTVQRLDRIHPLDPTGRDALDLPGEAVHTLLVPMQASWLKTAEAVDFMWEVSPERATGIYDGQINQRASSSINRWLAEHGGATYRWVEPGREL